MPRRPVAAARGGRELSSHAASRRRASGAARRFGHHVQDKEEPRTKGRVPPAARPVATVPESGQRVLLEAAKTDAARLAAVAATAAAAAVRIVFSCRRGPVPDAAAAGDGVHQTEEQTVRQQTEQNTRRWQREQIVGDRENGWCRHRGHRTTPETDQPASGVHEGQTVRKW